MSRSRPDNQAAQAAGTCDDRPRADARAAHAQRAVGTEVDMGAQPGTKGQNGMPSTSPCRDKKSLVSKGKKVTRATGFEPVTFGSVERKADCKELRNKAL